MCSTKLIGRSSNEFSISYGYFALDCFPRLGGAAKTIFLCLCERLKGAKQSRGFCAYSGLLRHSVPRKDEGNLLLAKTIFLCLCENVLYLVQQISPLWILTFNKRELLFSRASFYLFFARYCPIHGLVHFIVYEIMDVILFCEAFNSARLVLLHALFQVRCYASVERAISAARENVYAGDFFLHMSIILWIASPALAVSQRRFFFVFARTSPSCLCERLKGAKQSRVSARISGLLRHSVPRKDSLLSPSQRRGLLKFSDELEGVLEVSYDDVKDGFVLARGDDESGWRLRGVACLVAGDYSYLVDPAWS